MELVCLRDERLRDVFAAEDRFEVEVERLDFNPVLEESLDEKHEFLPSDRALFRELYVRIRADRLRFQRVVVE